MKIDHESDEFKRGWEARKVFDIKLLKTMPSYWVDRMIRTIKNSL
jgi:hypothetical protein